MGFTLADLRRIRGEARKIQSCPMHSKPMWVGIKKDKACDHAGFCDDCCDLLIVALSCVVDGKPYDAAVEEQRKLCVPADFKPPKPGAMKPKEEKPETAPKQEPPKKQGTEIPL